MLTQNCSGRPNGVPAVAYILATGTPLGRPLRFSYKNELSLLQFLLQGEHGFLQLCLSDRDRQIPPRLLQYAARRVRSTAQPSSDSVGKINCGQERVDIVHVAQ